MDMMAIRRRVLMASGKKRLPSEYQEVEWIESTGTQAILTDIPCQLPLKTDIDIMFTATANTDNYFCGTRYGSTRICSCGVYNTRIQWAFGSYQLTGGVNNNVRYLLSTYLENGSQIITKNDVNIYSYNRTLTNVELSNMNGNLGLFAMWVSNSQSFALFAKARCYGVRISNSIDLLGDFIPCYRKADGEIGMYDTVSKTFYTNDGTGTFLKGADV